MGRLASLRVNCLLAPRRFTSKFKSLAEFGISPCRIPLGQTGQPDKAMPVRLAGRGILRPDFLSGCGGRGCVRGCKQLDHVRPEHVPEDHDIESQKNQIGYQRDSLTAQE